MEAGGIPVWERMAAETRVDPLIHPDSRILEDRANKGFHINWLYQFESIRT